MTRKEFASRMQAITDRKGEDPEHDHKEADDLLCECLKSLGYSDGIEAYDNIQMWFA